MQRMTANTENILYFYVDPSEFQDFDMVANPSVTLQFDKDSGLMRGSYQSGESHLFHSSVSLYISDIKSDFIKLINLLIRHGCIEASNYDDLLHIAIRINKLQNKKLTAIEVMEIFDDLKSCIYQVKRLKSSITSYNLHLSGNLISSVGSCKDYSILFLLNHLKRIGVDVSVSISPKTTQFVTREHAAFHSTFAKHSVTRLQKKEAYLAFIKSLVFSYQAFTACDRGGYELLTAQAKPLSYEQMRVVLYLLHGDHPFDGETMKSVRLGLDDINAGVQRLAEEYVAQFDQRVKITPTPGIFKEKLNCELEYTAAPALVHQKQTTLLTFLDWLEKQPVELVYGAYQTNDGGTVLIEHPSHLIQKHMPIVQSKQIGVFQDVEVFQLQDHEQLVVTPIKKI